MLHTLFIITYCTYENFLENIQQSNISLILATLGNYGSNLYFYLFNFGYYYNSDNYERYVECFDGRFVKTANFDLSVCTSTIGLLLASPYGINFHSVEEALTNLKGVQQIHSLRIWSLTLDKVALSVHLVISDVCDNQEILNSATELFRKQFNIFECTVQIEHVKNDIDMKK